MPEVGDFVKSHNSGWRREYLNQCSVYLRQQKVKHKQDDAGESETRGIFPVGGKERGNCVRLGDSWGNCYCDHVGLLELAVHSVHNFAVHLRGLGALGHRIQDTLEVSSEDGHLE